MLLHARTSNSSSRIWQRALVLVPVFSRPQFVETSHVPCGLLTSNGRSNHRQYNFLPLPNLTFRPRKGVLAASRSPLFATTSQSAVHTSNIYHSDTCHFTGKYACKAKPQGRPFYSNLLGSLALYWPTLGAFASLHPPKMDPLNKSVILS